ncbi:MAG: DUF58 domain-containing protein [Candidatus Sumerlaeia bacterium]|nr:DUF58 domain-containing protein [Candidatus Sumerlaeia bacterium]
MPIPALLEESASARKIEILTRRIVSEVMAGEYHSVFKGQGMDFNEVREYQPGDDIRTIDWNVTARTSVPHIKRFKEERELTVLFAVDLSGSTLFGSGLRSKRNLAVLTTAVLAFSAIRNNDRVGLMLFTNQVEQYIQPRKGRGHTLRILNELLHQPHHRGTDIREALESLNRLQRRKCVVFLLSDFIQPNLEPILSVTSKRHDLICLTITDPRERRIPNVGMIELEDSETGERRLIDTSSRLVRSSIESRLNARSQEVRRLFQRLQIDHIPLTTEAEDFTRPVVEFFQRRALRKGGR